MLMSTPEATMVMETQLVQEDWTRTPSPVETQNRASATHIQKAAADPETPEGFAHGWGLGEESLAEYSWGSRDSGS